MKAFKVDDFLEIHPIFSKVFWEIPGLIYEEDIEEYIETPDQYKRFLNKALIRGTYVDSAIKGTFQITLKPDGDENWKKLEGNFEHRKYETIDLLCTIDSLNDEKLNNRIVEYVTKSLMKAYDPKLIVPIENPNN